MSTWTCLADELSLEGEALLFAADEREPALVQRSQAAGYRVVEVDTAGVTDFRVAQARIAAVLRLPESAGRNLTRWPTAWATSPATGPTMHASPCSGGTLRSWIERDTAGWFRLADVLQDATQRLWRGGNDPADRLFETVLLVPGFDA